MKPEEQRIAIAEACGWRCELVNKYSTQLWLGDNPYQTLRTFKTGSWMMGGDTDTRLSSIELDISRGTDLTAYVNYLPDYLNDLNAMRKAEDVLDPDLFITYIYHLKGFLTCDPELEQYWLVRSSAAQRAEAFLRTLNLWTE